MVDQIDARIPANPPERVHSELAAQAFDPSTAGPQLQSLARRLNAEQSAFDQDVAKQGFIGKTFDYLKGTVGASTPQSAFDSVADAGRYAWSYLFSYDSSSRAISHELKQSHEFLDRASAAQQRGDGGEFAAALADLTISQPGKPAELKVAGVADTYDSSQRREVELASDLLAVGSAALMRQAFVFAGLAKLSSPVIGAAAQDETVGTNLAASILGGALGKPTIKWLDGGYFHPLDDVFSGALVGMTIPLGRAAHGFADSLAGRYTTMGLTNRVAFSHAADSAVAGGVLNGVTAFEDARWNGQSFGASLLSGSKQVPFGIGFGAFAGYSMGLAAAWWHPPVPATSIASTLKRPGAAADNGLNDESGTIGLRGAAAGMTPVEHGSKEIVAVGKAIGTVIIKSRPHLVPQKTIANAMAAHAAQHRRDERYESDK